MHKIAIGCDPNATDCKIELIKSLEKKGYEVVDFGSDDPIYANTAFAVGGAVASGECDRGILICGTGLGMSMAANKVKGVLAGLITDPYSAERARKSNNAKIACFGAFTQGFRVIEYLANIFLTSEYVEGTPSAPKVQAMFDYDNNRA